jgi:glycine cleavage system H protein
VFPDDLRYTAEHEWVRRVGDDTVRVGITADAQDQLGDIVVVSLPTAGTDVAAGQSLGEVESTKSVSEIYAPLAGTIAERNETLSAQPELVNADPYGDGWMVEIRLADAAAVDGALAGLMDADAYRTTVDTA